MVLHGNSSKTLIQSTATLTENARLVQEILRQTILLKSGDTRKIIAQLSYVIYMILEREPFDVADFILSIVPCSFRLKSPNWKKLKNRPLGAVIQWILYKKYTWIDPEMYVNDCIPMIYSTSGTPSIGRST
ncbi:hypothetical protein KSP40_PGU005376 [Platanthera guangdongensis]|uniref:Uncharacterized protein n=1 Tax=Platanthera guangdongensis TaxID=2320717 RepID=A0ABR2LFH7_9ASPA